MDVSQSISRWQQYQSMVNYHVLATGAHKPHSFFVNCYIYLGMFILVVYDYVPFRCTLLISHINDLVQFENGGCLGYVIYCEFNRMKHPNIDDKVYEVIK